MIFIYKKHEKPAFCLIWSKNNKISNLRGQLQSESITIRLTKWSSKVPRQFFAMKKYTKKLWELFL